MNPLSSAYEADVPTVLLKAQAASQAAGSLTVLIGILHFSLSI